MNSIEQSITRVQQCIRDAELSAGRRRGSAELLAVSKTRPAADLRKAWQSGQRRFAENYLQEAEEKINALSDLEIEWHFIGRIQSNKTRVIARLFDWVHTVDRIKIAQRLNDQRPTEMPAMNICLQVNISAEESKSGTAPGDLDALVDAVQMMPQLKLRGLMALPAPTSDFKQQKMAFDKLSCLQQGLLNRGLELDTLSMGTSNDMQAAIMAGATLVRIGTAVFGPRL